MGKDDKPILVKIEMTNEDGTRFDWKADARYYAMHPEELKNADLDEKVHIKIKVRFFLPFVVAALLLCAALTFFFLYRGGG
jgi:hypothetical protein